MEPSKSVDPARRPAASDGYPWAREREALEAAGRLAIEPCRAALQKLTRELRAPYGPGVAASLLVELLGRLQARLRSEPPSRPERLRRARRLGSARTLEAVREAFLGEAGALLASLAGEPEVAPAVHRARSFLDRNYTRRVTLREVAEEVQLSPNYLSALFRRETGTTVTAYLSGLRMRMAERLLLEGRHPIREVAGRVGYRNYRDFHRNFVQQAGRSPREFQRLGGSRRADLES